jgi:hypothetical protein
MTRQFAHKTFSPPRALRVLDLPADRGGAHYRLTLRREQLRHLHRLMTLPESTLAGLGLSQGALATRHARLSATSLKLGFPVEPAA